jgi:hypothetical protein
MFSSGAPDPNPVQRGRPGLPAERVARRVAHYQRHDRRFVVSTRLVSRAQYWRCKRQQLCSSAASRRVGARVDEK